LLILKADKIAKMAQKVDRRYKFATGFLRPVFTMACGKFRHLP
jgi:hypothetical protein